MFLAGANLVFAFSTLNYAQVHTSAQSTTASHVAAEMTKGKLNPGESKPGDTVVVKLKDDVKANGAVVMKKGSSITGVVRNAKRVEGSGAAKSMMEIEWLAPEMQGTAAQSLSIALQSVTQVNPIYRHEQETAADQSSPFGAVSAAPAARPVRAANGGLLAGTVGGVVGTAGTVATGAAGAVNTVGSSVSSGVAARQSNTALLNMPSVVAADAQTATAIDSGLGASSSGQLFKVGRGQLVSAGGSQQSLDIFSHLNNDTVITAAAKDFEITAGAQMQLLVGVGVSKK
jgi:hypothetical protein